MMKIMYTFVSGELTSRIGAFPRRGKGHMQFA